jgi:hypothetical protein
MSELSQAQKIDVIKSCGINYIESKYSVGEIYEVCREKELVAPRLNGALDCFGFIDEKSPACTKCYLNKKGVCKKMQDYLQYFNNFKYNPAVVILTSKNGVVAMEDSEVILKKLNIREQSMQYKIARVILDSNDTAFNALIEKIREIIGPEKGSYAYAKVRFYQTKTLLERKGGLQIELLIQKFIHFKKKVEPTNGPDTDSTTNNEASL